MTASANGGGRGLTGLSAAGQNSDARFDIRLIRVKASCRQGHDIARAHRVTELNLVEVLNLRPGYNLDVRPVGSLEKEFSILFVDANHSRLNQDLIGDLRLLGCFGCGCACGSRG